MLEVGVFLGDCYNEVETFLVVGLNLGVRINKVNPARAGVNLNLRSELLLII
jgi:hypothetical protein